ncbi:MAG: Eco57I restriction-modification methylase domain-containing protein, partial [bacterium]|nr:Eco57I restriction-modification methylase domain-containing protein [bacterium]
RDGGATSGVPPAEQSRRDGGATSGFDVILGNPPYVRQETLGATKDYFAQHYAVYHGMADLYAYFIERAVMLLRDGGVMSYIVANKWMRASYGAPLRRFLKQHCIEEITDFGDLPVFKGVTTYPCIMRVARRQPCAAFNATQVATLDFTDLNAYVAEHRYAVNIAGLDDAGWSLANADTQCLLDKLRAKGMPLGEYVKGKIYYGIKTGLNEAFVINAATRDRLIAEDPKSAELIKPFLAGRDIKRYEQPHADKFLIFTRRGIEIGQYKAIEKHLLAFKERLLPKPLSYSGTNWKGRKSGNYQWYEIQDAVDYYSEFGKPKIMYLVFQVRPSFVYLDYPMYANNAVWMIPGDDKYLLAILNSKLGWYLISKHCTQIQNGFQLIYEYLRRIPIRTINFSDAPDKKRHAQVTDYVATMLALHQKRAAARTPDERTQLANQIAATDRLIDKLVYELYDLSAAEIQIVERDA